MDIGRQTEPRPLRLGLTGGIGSGKSTFGQMLADCGARVVDADQIARSLTAAGGDAIGAIRTAFGPGFIGADGAMDRAAMRSHVFADGAAKARLEAILHPLVGAAIQRAAQAAEDTGCRLLVLDIPLLVESGRWAGQLDAVAVVDCTEATQIARVQARSGLEVAAIQAILASQAPRERRRRAADTVVYNEGISLTDLQAHARQTAALFGL